MLYLFTFGVYGCGWLYDLFHLSELMKDSSSWSSGSGYQTPGEVTKGKILSPSAASPTLLLSAPAAFPSTFPPSPDKHVMLSSSSSSSPSSLFSPVLKAGDQHDSALLSSHSEEEGGEEGQETAAVLPPSPTLQLVRVSNASLLCASCLQPLHRSSVVGQDSDSPLPSYRHLSCLDAATVAVHAPGKQYSLITGWEQLRDDEKRLAQTQLNAVLETQLHAGGGGGAAAAAAAALPAAHVVKSAEVEDADVYTADSEPETVRLLDKREQDELRNRQPASGRKDRAHESSGRGAEEVSSGRSNRDAPQVQRVPGAAIAHTEAFAAPHPSSGVVISAPVMSSSPAAPSPSAATSTPVFVTCSSCGVGKSVDEYSLAELGMQQGRVRCIACCQAEAAAADRQEMKNGGGAAGENSSGAQYRLRGRRGVGGSAAGRRR